MALPSSGQISLNDVRTELGQSGQISLTESNVRTLFGVSSGQISLHDGYGKSWLNASIADLNIVNESGSATYALTSAGNATTSEGYSSPWKLSGASSSYEVFASYVSTGDGLTFGTLNTWLSLSGDRVWGIVAAPGTLKTTTLMIQIRRTTDNAVLDSATVVLTADNI